MGAVAKSCDIKQTGSKAKNNPQTFSQTEGKSTEIPEERPIYPENCRWYNINITIYQWNIK